MMEKFTEEEKSIPIKAAREGTEPSTQLKAKFVRVVEELKGCHETIQFIVTLGKKWSN